jgi:nucleoid-associated protein YgaU
LSIGCDKPKDPVIAAPPTPQTPDEMSALPESPTPPGPGAMAADGYTGGTTNDGGRMYTVKKGEGLMAIARTQLGNASRWKEILSLNPDISAPNQIKVGQVIKLPAK